MKLVAVLLFIACIVSVAPGQWVEKTIVLPDSLSALGIPGTMVYNTGNNFLFIGCDSGVAIVDGFSDRLIARTPTRSLRDYPACYAPQVNKVYWLGGEYGSRTFVLDGATGRDLKHLLTPNAGAICYNPQANKVYCGDYYGCNVMVIDGTTDDVIAIDSAGVFSASLCYSPRRNKVYVGSAHNGVTVVDGGSNQVVARIEGFTARRLCYDSLNDKVYCASNAYDVAVIDAAGDSLLRYIPDNDGPWDVCYNPVQNRVYVSNEGNSTISVLRDSGGGIEETMDDERGTMNAAPTVIRGVLFLPGAASHKPQATSLMDATGRKVLDLKPGANDVRAIVPGVYFVRAESRELSAASCYKIVVTR
ncbi:YncE family protein [candidate division WOR-3 bacterium]|uniref:YncE family protein n=1 Tax=candidate division WOR-3 bacterium TaxID=2052148 RepID=A0A937XDT0_UNCW3|nr:YncE family protein [candidate division WOR-3 bacterium]